jgi:hypothetical protein
MLKPNQSKQQQAGGRETGLKKMKQPVRVRMIQPQTTFGYLVDFYSSGHDSDLACQFAVDGLLFR